MQFVASALKQGMRMKQMTKTRLIALTEWQKIHKYPTTKGLQHLISYAKRTGFDDVIIHDGNRVLIDESAYFRWVGESKIY
jgi:hypothetical protein